MSEIRDWGTNISVLGRAPVLACGWRSCLVCRHTVEGEKAFCCLIRTLFQQDQCPTLMTSFNPNYFHKDLYPNIVTLGVKAWIYELGGERGTQFSPQHGVRQV